MSRVVLQVGSRSRLAFFRDFNRVSFLFSWGEFSEVSLGVLKTIMWGSLYFLNNLVAVAGNTFSAGYLCPSPSGPSAEGG